MNMAYRTLETVLHPDSHLALPAEELPQRPVRVMVTILDAVETKWFGKSAPGMAIHTPAELMGN